MPTISFPSSPSLNDTYTFGGKTWVWNGAAWALNTDGGINGVPIGNTTPASGAFTTLTSTGNTSLGNIAANLLPAANITYDLGSTSQRWNDLWLANSTIYIGNAQISANATALIMTNPAGGQTVLSGSSTVITASQITATGNIDAGNLRTTGLISATGNVTGNYILGNGSQLTGIDATSIQSGTSNVRVVSSGGNVAVGVGGTSNVAVYATTGEFITGLVSATGNITGGNLSGTNIVGTLTTAAQTNITSVGTLTSLNSGTISSSGNVTGANILTGGLVSATGNVNGGNLVAATVVQGTTLSATGNVNGGNLNLSGDIFDTGALTIITGSNGNITLSPNGTGVIIASKDLLNGQANGVGNIGNATGYFNTIFAKATSAQYADVAEKYVADRYYAPGTVLEIGGAAEVQETTHYASTRIAGVVSTNPALIMNSTEKDVNSVELALLGRVPCRVTGDITRGDLVTSSHKPGLATALVAGDYKPGCVIGKALASHSGPAEGVIEILVGRL